MGKSLQLPFSSSVFHAVTPLERTHCDLWGNSPVTSVQVLSIMLCLWITSLAIVGFIHYNSSQISSLCLLNSRSWLKINLIQKSRSFKVMVEVNLLKVSS